MKANFGLLALIATLLTSTNATATDIGEACYVQMCGEGLTTCVPEFDEEGKLVDPCPETLGVYRLVLGKSTDGPGKWHLRLGGPVRGLANPDLTLNHVLGDGHADGLLYTSGDTLVEVSPVNDCLWLVEEELYVTFGTGKYAGAHGTIKVTGEMNTCTGVNKFEAVSGEGRLCFSGVAIIDDSDITVMRQQCQRCHVTVSYSDHGNFDLQCRQRTAPKFIGETGRGNCIAGHVMPDLPENGAGVRLANQQVTAGHYSETDVCRY